MFSKAHFQSKTNQYDTMGDGGWHTVQIVTTAKQTNENSKLSTVQLFVYFCRCVAFLAAIQNIRYF